MIRNLIASFVVALALGSASVGFAQEIVPANHVSGGPVVVEGSCQGGSCQGGSCARCPDCVRVPDVKVTTDIVYCSKCVEKCAPKCSLFGLFTGHCESCESGDCEHYCVRKLMKKVVTTECPTTKCVPASQACAASVTIAVPAPAAVVVPAPMPAPTPMVAPKVQ